MFPKRGKARAHNTALKFGILALLFGFFTLISNEATTSFISQAIPKRVLSSISQLSHDPFNNGSSCFSPINFPGPPDTYCKYLERHCNEALINYMRLYYCSGVSHSALWLIAFIEVIILFYYLARAADHYFCPVLELLATSLHMSDEVAGLTILALGNGAPDIASIFSAITGNSYDIEIGELFGSSFFITSVVVGCVSMISDAEVNRYDFFKDIITLLIVSCGIVVMTHFGEITWWQAFLLVLLYIFYISFSIGVHYYYLWKDSKGRKTLSLKTFDGNISSSMIEQEEMESKVSLLDSVTNIEDLQHQQEFFSVSAWRLKWVQMTRLEKFFYVLVFPIRVPLMLTVPRVDVWNRFLNSVSAMTSPLIILLSLHRITATVRIGEVEFPIAVIILLCGLVVSLVLFFTSSWDSKPIYFPLYVILSLVSSTTWIYMAANEIVAIVQAFGLILGVSNIILGATVLAWGNSLGDLVSNVVMARHGAPRMAIAACFGGPVFNILVGLGVSLTYTTITIYPKPYFVEATHIFYLTAAFLIGSLVASIIIVPLLSGYVYVKPMGGFLIAGYILFCIFAVLISVGLLWPDSS